MAKIVICICELSFLCFAKQNIVSKMEIQMSRYVSPVNPAVFPHLTLVLMSIGLFFTAWFFVYEVTSSKFTRDIYKELLVALVASLFLGFGILFLLLWVGIYV
ncbi:transmembrane 258 [Paramuricea clavata]|uniref:Dolichyl-diphosphooligosaccharide-protein glycosyltransferase subunit TMEM258 n=2 Tax=Paramuricea clavata TaxID=317549 RepID=A0A7D9EF02_PARCT|nr:transmembrane 258 [Paramuricea clavata]